MAYFKLLIISLCLFWSQAHAGYAQLKPPPGWSAGMGAGVTPVPGQIGTFNFGAAANGSTFKGGTVLTNAALNVGGRSVTMPVSMRVAANAATIANRWSFSNPWFFAASLAAPIAINWYFGEGLELVDGIWQERDKSICTSGCKNWIVSGDIRTASITKAGAAALWCSLRNYPGAVASSNMFGWMGPGWLCGTNYAMKDPSSFSQIDVPPVENIVYKPVTEPRFQEIMNGLPMPDGMPLELPKVDFPIENPVINPDPSVNPQPAPSPLQAPRPLFIPTGIPVQDPIAVPPVWNQPGVRVTPAPTPSSPWQVDVSPVSIPQESPTPKTDEELNPPTPPASAPLPAEKGLCDQYPDIAACAPAQKEFCEKNPDSLACQKTDTPEVPDLEKKDISIAITPDSGWGAGGGSCPADRAMSHASFSFAPYCSFAAGINPVLVAVAWLVAAGILIGYKAD